MSILYHNLSQDNYISLRDIVINLFEVGGGDQTVPQNVGDGDVTIGIGFDLTTNLNLRNDVFEQLGLNLTPQSVDSPYLKELNKDIGTKNQTTTEIQTELNKIMAVRAQAENLTNGPTTFSLTSAQIINIYNGPDGVSNYESSLNDYFDLTNNKGLGNLSQPVSSSLERITLLSLDYNNLEKVIHDKNGIITGYKSPNLRSDIINGNRAESWFQIRYNSNAEPASLRGGIAARRDFESDLFGLYDAGAFTNTDANQNQEALDTYAMVTNHHSILFPADGSTSLPDQEVSQAQSNYNAAIQAVVAIDPGFAVNTLDDDLKPATDYLLAHYAPNGSVFTDQDILVYTTADSKAKDTINLRKDTDNALTIVEGTTPQNQNTPNAIETASAAPLVVLFLDNQTNVTWMEASGSLYLGTGADTVTLTGTTYTVYEPKGLSAATAAADTITFLGQGIGETFYAGQSMTDQYGRTYALTGSSLQITDAQNDSLTIAGFRNGDFGVNFSVAPPSINIPNGGTVEVSAAQGSSGEAIYFNGNSGTLIIDDTQTFNDTVYGFQKGDEIYLPNVRGANTIVSAYANIPGIQVSQYSVLGGNPYANLSFNIVLGSWNKYVDTYGQSPPANYDFSIGQTPQGGFAIQTIETLPDGTRPSIDSQIQLLAQYMAAGFGSHDGGAMVTGLEAGRADPHSWLAAPHGGVHGSLA